MGTNLHNRGSRPGDPYFRDNAASENSVDPLVELARLIGQNDPFTDPSNYPQERSHAGRERAAAEPYGSPGDHYFPDQGGYHANEPYGHALNNYGADSDDNHPLAQQSRRANHEIDYDSASDDGFYEAPRRTRVRNILFSVAAVASIIVIGTAGTFIYRSIFSRGISTPPIIRADGSPNKILPARTADTSNKQIYDRYVDRVQNERVVIREEQPLEIGNQIQFGRSEETVAAAGLNTVRTLRSNSGYPQQQIQGNGEPNQLATGSISSEPKKVRTVAIRGDLPNIAEPQDTPVAVTPPSVASQPINPSSVQPAQQPQLRPQRSQQASANSDVQPNRGQVSTLRHTNTPLSLAPQANGRVTPTNRVASLASSVPSAGASGEAFVVQLSAQRSEAEAHASFRSIQAKFSNQLGGHKPLIKRKDLGDKGIYFGAQVGPFASRELAVQLCESLKNAGGTCIVQKN